MLHCMYGCAVSNILRWLEVGHTHLTVQSSCSLAASSLQKASRLLSISVCCFCSSAQAIIPSKHCSAGASAVHQATTSHLHDRRMRVCGIQQTEMSSVRPIMHCSIS